MKREAPAVARNREPILDKLRQLLPDGGRVLEVASGTGEHAVYLARHHPRLHWYPTDADPHALASAEAWYEEARLPNVARPAPLDVTQARWWQRAPSAPDRVDAIFNANMIHISPWQTCEGLIVGAPHLLEKDGLLVFYGPFLEANHPTTASNLAFDEQLKSISPAYGLRQVEQVEALAASHGLCRAHRFAMPANNLLVAFRNLGGTP